MIGLIHIYWLAGVFLAVTAVFAWRDDGNPRRYTTSIFWGLLALAFLAGDLIPARGMGVLVIVLALLAGGGGVRLGRYPELSATERARRRQRLGSRLFLPALAIPVLTLAGSLGLKSLHVGDWRLVDPAQATIISLGLACAIAFGFALRLTRESPALALQESRRLLDAIGWAALLPLMLATLGGVFARAGVGEAVAGLSRELFPLDTRFAAVLAYGLGMVVFTLIMGNAFAAFPVMTAGIGLPILVQRFGADPAPLAALGMLTGYCGTLLTPMAANFNVVPAALLELEDKHAVIKAQWPTALLLLAVNLILMNFLVFLS